MSLNLSIDDDYLVDGGEAGAEDERATQASATITKNAAHLKSILFIPSS